MSPTAAAAAVRPATAVRASRARPAAAATDGRQVRFQFEGRARAPDYFCMSDAILGAKSEGEIIISGATLADIPIIKQLLIANKLPTDGIDDHWKTFIVARDGDDIVGCGGAEAHKLAALIRSVAVAESHRGRSIGRRLVRQLLHRLASPGIRELYLLTTTAPPY